LLFLALGLATAVGGSYAPARAAGKLAPAVAIRQGGDLVDPREPPLAPCPAPDPARRRLLLPAGDQRLPLFGYLAVALVLAGGVAAMPWLARTLLRRWRGSTAAVRRSRWRSGGCSARRRRRRRRWRHRRQHRADDRDGVMVTSFRGSVEDWLDTFLSGDLYLSGGPRAARSSIRRRRRGSPQRPALPDRLCQDRAAGARSRTPLGAAAGAAARSSRLSRCR
jgi:putative ABC transport system permease protein